MKLDQCFFYFNHFLCFPHQFSFIFSIYDSKKCSKQHSFCFVLFFSFFPLDSLSPFSCVISVSVFHSPNVPHPFSFQFSEFVTAFPNTFFLTDFYFSTKVSPEIVEFLKNNEYAPCRY